MRKVRQRSGCVRRKSVASNPGSGNKDAAHGFPAGRRLPTMVESRVGGRIGCASERKANGTLDKEPMGRNRRSRWSGKRRYHSTRFYQAVSLQEVDIDNLHSVNGARLLLPSADFTLWVVVDAQSRLAGPLAPDPLWIEVTALKIISNVLEAVFPRHGQSVPHQNSIYLYSW